MKNFSFTITQDVIKLGVKGLMARVVNITNTKSNKEFDEFFSGELEKIREIWRGKDWKKDKILLGFKELHEKVGRSNRKYPASPEVLLGLFLESRRFPRINLLVDIYNLISLKTRLALGAHDVEKINGNVALRLTNGSEKFLPLGSKDFVPVPAGEYSYIDDGNNIICRMEVLQVESTKITLDTKDVFLIVQGNANTDNNYIQKGANEVLDLITRYCGGSFTYLNTLT